MVFPRTQHFFTCERHYTNIFVRKKSIITVKTTLEKKCYHRSTNTGPHPSKPSAIVWATTTVLLECNILSQQHVSASLHVIILSFEKRALMKQDQNILLRNYDRPTWPSTTLGSAYIPFKLSTTTFNEFARPDRWGVKKTP